VTAKKRGRPPGPRIRTIKPEMPEDERVGGRLSVTAELLFVRLISMADDEGRFQASTSRVVGFAFPHREMAPAKVRRLLREIEAQGLILLYRHEQMPYGVVVNFRKHQNITRPTASSLPPCPVEEVTRANAIPADELHAQGDEYSVSNHDGSNEHSQHPPRVGAQVPVPDPLPGRASTTTTEDAKAQREIEIREIWEHYLDAFYPDRRGNLPDLRAHRQHIVAALRVRPVEACKLAVTGLARSDFHRGQNGDGKRWTEIRYALHGNQRERESDAERIDRMAARAADPVASFASKLAGRASVDDKLEQLRRESAGGDFIEGSEAA
jgi:hypothetical protein